MRWALSFLISTIFFFGCMSPAVKREQARYPKCDVSQKDKSGDVIIIEITCPGKEPFEKTYHTK